MGHGVSYPWYVHLEFRIDVCYPPCVRAYLANGLLVHPGGVSFPSRRMAFVFHRHILTREKLKRRPGRCWLSCRLIFLSFFFISFVLSYFLSFVPKHKKFSHSSLNRLHFTSGFFLFQFYFCRHGIFNNRFRGSKAA